MKIPQISVVIVSFNTKNVLQNCLESLYKTKMVSFEIIIVDNASQDETIGYLDKILEEKDNIQLIKNDYNAGFAKATNQGIRVAKAKRILLLNSDTLLSEKTLRQLIYFSKIYGDESIMAPALLNADGTIQASCFRFPTIIGAVAEFWLGKEGRFSKYIPKGATPKVVDAAVGAALLIPRKVIDKIGLLDERFFMYFEDIDYCRRAKMNGIKVVYLPLVKITHIHGESGKSRPKRTNSWLEQSSKSYHGFFKYNLLYLILLVGQKIRKNKKK
jgi:GT2 family glycosyltransferase